MPSKKRKFNARFPPARIKKIMQTDDDVGKVAAAVPLIISRALELFLESLILKTNDTTNSRNARTLTCSHIKQTVLSEGKFDFLKDLVANVPDVQAEEGDGDGHPGRETGHASGTGKPRGRPRKPRPEGAPPLGRPRKRKTPTSSTDESCDNNEHRTDEDETDEASEDTEQDDSPDASNPWPAAALSAPPKSEVTDDAPNLSPHPKVKNEVETSPTKFDPSTLANKILMKQSQGCVKSEDRAVVPGVTRDGSSVSTLGQEHIKIEDSVVKQESAEKEDSVVKQESAEKELNELKVVPQQAGALKVEAAHLSDSSSSHVVPPKNDLPRPNVQKRETPTTNFPHHIENLIRPDAPKRDNMLRHLPHNVSDLHLPKDHDNNIAGKCPPQIAGLHQLEGQPGFPLHLPPTMLQSGHQVPCFPHLMREPLGIPLTMAQHMHLAMPPPNSTLPLTQTHEDDDYDS